VTIEARREREIKRQINNFISGAIFTYLNDSLERWNRPICPLVAGLAAGAGRVHSCQSVRDRQGRQCASRVRTL
jgi:hypothetical protein